MLPSSNPEKASSAVPAEAVAATRAAAVDTQAEEAVTLEAAVVIRADAAASDSRAAGTLVAEVVDAAVAAIQMVDRAAGPAR